MYDIVAVPSAKLVTIPVLLSIAATIALLLLHFPPTVLFDSGNELPEHEDNTPVISAGSGFIVSK